MNKHLLLFKVTMGMILMLSCGLVSCGDDDDEGGEGSTSAGVLDKETNKRLRSVGDYTYSYNDKGQLDYITEGNTRYTFTYNPNKIIQTHRNEEEAVYSVTYNGLGYITRIEAKVSFEEDGTVEITGSATMSYDKSGHLVSVKSSSTQTYRGETSKSSGTGTLTWKNNLLMSAVWEGTETDNDGTETSIESYEYEYASNINDYHNKHHQYAPSLKGAYGDEPDDALAFIGLYGRGPLYLPMRCTETWNYSDAKTRAGDSGGHTDQFSYGFNDDGSISYCSVNNHRYNYAYDDLYADTRSITVNDDDSKGRRLFRLLFPIQNNKHKE